MLPSECAMQRGRRDQDTCLSDRKNDGNLAQGGVQARQFVDLIAMPKVPEATEDGSKRRRAR